MLALSQALSLLLVSFLAPEAVLIGGPSCQLGCRDSFSRADCDA